MTADKGETTCKTDQRTKGCTHHLIKQHIYCVLGIGLIIPVMPLFMNVMHLTGSTMGYLVAAFAVAQLIASPLRGDGLTASAEKS